MEFDLSLAQHSLVRKVTALQMKPKRRHFILISFAKKKDFIEGDKLEEQQIILPSRAQMPALASLSVIWAGDDQDIYCSMVRSTLKGLLTTDIRAFLMFIFFFFFQQEIPVKSLSSFMMLSDCGPQPYSAHGEAGISSKTSPTASEIKGTQTEAPPDSGSLTSPLVCWGLLSWPYHHVHLKEHLAPPDRYWFL